MIRGKYYSLLIAGILAALLIYSGCRKTVLAPAEKKQTPAAKAAPAEAPTEQAAEKPGNPEEQAGQAVEPEPQARQAAPVKQEAKPKPEKPGKKGKGKKPELPTRRMGRGEFFAQALINIMQEEFDSNLGWRTNDLVIGRLLENHSHYQLGKLDVVRETVRVFKEDIARIAGTDEINANLSKAEVHFYNSATKFWFPSAERMYKTGIVDLKNYIEGLPSNESKFDPRSDNLYKLYVQYLNLLGDAHHQLINDNLAYLETDDAFYYSLGIMAALQECYKAIYQDFDKTIQERGLKKQMDESILALEKARGMHPLIVLNGGADDWRANHRNNLAAYVSETRYNTYTMVEILQK